MAVIQFIALYYNQSCDSLTKQKTMDERLKNQKMNDYIELNFSNQHNCHHKDGRKYVTVTFVRLFYKVQSCIMPSEQRQSLGCKHAAL